ncbi:hypothetical protein RRG08_022258 [Elysia crispata]|uniref:Uncharacterized protein n=1 Tax=Elysia crispata TaxID=231223 RepID=A0AAE0ZS17_9GAST|nr:hypothetical protein RRG08_022258 [Elysia crispata]
MPLKIFPLDREDATIHITPTSAILLRQSLPPQTALNPVLDRSYSTGMIHQAASNPDTLLDEHNYFATPTGLPSKCLLPTCYTSCAVSHGGWLTKLCAVSAVCHGGWLTKLCAVSAVCHGGWLTELWAVSAVCHGGWLTELWAVSAVCHGGWLTKLCAASAVCHGGWLTKLCAVGPVCQAGCLKPCGSQNH